MQEDFATFDVLGVPISVTDLDSAAAATLRWQGDGRARSVGVRDVASVMALRDDPALIALTRRTAMNVPDGMPLVWIGKARGLPVGRTSGADLMQTTLALGVGSGLKHFFYGGKEGVAELLAKRMRAAVPGLCIVGTYCPPFRALTTEEDAAVVARIRDSRADVVWVGISSPRQDIWMDSHLDRLPVTMVGVGAAFDFLAGTVRRAPRWMQRSGLEWAHRLASEPHRLWRRYLVLAPKFVWLIAREGLGRRSRHARGR